MPSSPAEKRLTGILAVCLRELVDELGAEPAWLPEYQPKRELGDMFAAIVEFSGEELRGSFALAGKLPVLARLYPFIARNEQSDMVDWTKELANQALGRFKNRVLAYGLTLIVGTPRNIPAPELSVARMQKRTGIPLAIAIEDMILETWLALDIGSGFKLADQPVSQNGPALSEGTVVLF